MIMSSKWMEGRKDSRSRMEKKLTRISSIDSVATIWAIKKVTNKNKNIKKTNKLLRKIMH